MSDFRDSILELKVIDTHNHLDYNNVIANDFWDLGEYYWLLRHLWGAGYPKDFAGLPMKQRAFEFIKAFKGAENTIWCRSLKKAIRDLYGLELTNEKSVFEIDEAVKGKAKEQGWAKKVLEMTKIEKAVVNSPEKHTEFIQLPNVCVTVPRIDPLVRKWAKRAANGEEVETEIFNLLSGFKMDGRTGIMTKVDRLDTSTHTDFLVKNNMTYSDGLIAVLHYISRGAEKLNMFVQFFLGVEDGYASQCVPANDPDSITKLFGLFERYNCNYDLVISSQANNIDVVNAGNVFSNVYAGGLWWYNFRPSSYMEAMGQRLEALPSIKSSIVATDAKCLEWCYTKLLVVKETLSLFLEGQIKHGTIDSELALKVAGDWLYNTPAKLLSKEGQL